MYWTYIFVALGGAVGSLSRYLLSTWIYNKTQQIFPLGTFVVNILGCFLLGLFFTLSLDRWVISPEIRIMIAVGFLGGFTTFSTFGLETINIIKEGNLHIALLNVGLSVFVGVLAVWLGMEIANFFRGDRGRRDEYGKTNRTSP